MDKRKLAVAYILLVGFPLLTLVAILRAGSHLTAPIAVHGNWKVQADFGPWRESACGALLINAQQPLLSISQSGGDLAVTLHDHEDTILGGTIEGFTLSETPFSERAETVSAPQSDRGCAGQQLLRLQAAVHQQGKQRSLKGAFQLEGCAGCPPIAFSATRQLPTGRDEQ